jgi:two-component system response regulator YesN
LRGKLRRTFSSLLISYMIMMVFTVSVGIITYYSALNVVEKDAVEANLSMLKQSSEVIDAHLKEVESVVSQIGFNYKVISFLGSNSSIDSSSGSSEYPKAIEIWNYIQTYKFTSDFIYNFYLGFNNSNMIMSPKDLSLKMAMYYERSLQYSGMSFETWYAEIMEKYHNAEYMPAHNVVIEGKSNSYITYLQSLPFGFRSSIKGTMIVLIAESEIHKLLYRGDLTEGGWSYIADAKGNILTSITDNNRQIDISGIHLQGAEGFIQLKLAGEDMLLSYYTSPFNQWKYVSAVPNLVVMKKVDSIRSTNTIIITIGLILGMLIAIFFANRHSKPIRAIIQKFNEKFSIEHGSDSNEYHFLDHSIARLIHNNETLHSEIDKQMPLLRAALLDRLFRGEFNDHSELNTAFSEVGIVIRGNWFVVAVLRLEWIEEQGSSDGIETENVKRAIIKDLLYRELRESGFIHDLGQERIAILLSLSQNERAESIASTNEMIGRLSDMLNKHTDIEVVFGLGCMYGHLLDVYRSFKEALKALEMANYSRGEYILRYEHIPKGDGGYYYPIEIEQRIMNLVKSGNQEEVNKLLKDIHSEVLAGSKISSDTMKLLVFDISATVYKLINEVFQLHGGNERQEYGEFIESVSAFSTFQEAFEYITQILTELCVSVNNQKKSHNFELRDKIIDYIDGNYTDGSLCLSSVADFYGINEVYLSQFFKEQTGESFSGYMEKMRMNHARELLKKDHLTVDDIAKQVGYLNTNTFYKAFKRVEGVSPGTFRNKSGNALR